MPSATPTDPLPKWQRPAPTKHDLPWADIAIIDLSTYDEPGGKEKLAEELRDAVRTREQKSTTSKLTNYRYNQQDSSA